MSSRNDWATPHDLFSVINNTLGPFELDVAASSTNHKTPLYITAETDALVQPWAPGWWCNPPYSKFGTSVLPEWCTKFVSEASVGNWGVALLPYDSSTAWFNDIVYPNATRLIILRGPRIEFIDPTGAQRDQPRGTHFLAQFTNYKERNPTLFWDWRNEPLIFSNPEAVMQMTIDRLTAQNKKLFDRYTELQQKFRMTMVSRIQQEDDDDDDDTEGETGGSVPKVGDAQEVRG